MADLALPVPAPLDGAIEALETWIEVYDGAVLEGYSEPEAVERADEVLRIAGPRPSHAVVSSLNDILKEFYIGPTSEPGAVLQYDPPRTGEQMFWDGAPWKYYPEKMMYLGSNGQWATDKWLAAVAPPGTVLPY